MRGGPGEATATAPTPGPPARRERRVLPLLCACQFLVILDVSIVNVALPSIDRDLGFSVPGLAWVVNGYLLPFAGFMLLGGRAADLFGHRRMLIVGLALFSVSSLVAGLAPTPDVLVPARAAQGVGAALLAPATLAVLNTSFSNGAARARAFAAWSAAGGVGGMAGALLGGALTTGLSWRWVFLVNLPLGAVLVVVATRCLARAPAGPRGALDLPGSLVGTAGLAALVYGVMQLAEQGWTATAVVVPAGAGVLLLAGFLLIEARYAAEPMLPLRLLTVRSVAVGNGMLLLFGGVAIAMWYFTSLLLQDVLGFRAIDAGLGQTPAAVTFVVVARVAAGLLRRAGVRLLVLAGCGCLVAGFGWLAQVDGSSAYATAVLGPMLLVATGIGLTFPTLMALATAEVRPADAGIVGGLANTASQVGGALGLGVLTSAAGAGAAAQASAGSPAADLVQGYGVVFLVAAGLALGLAALTALLPSSRRSEPVPLSGAAG
jgi:EmrB/QacA subfamily drug resistance transporter